MQIKEYKRVVTIPGGNKTYLDLGENNGKTVIGIVSEVIEGKNDGDFSCIFGRDRQDIFVAPPKYILKTRVIAGIIVQTWESYGVRYCRQIPNVTTEAQKKFTDYMYDKIRSDYESTDFNEINRQYVGTPTPVKINFASDAERRVIVDKDITNHIDFKAYVSLHIPGYTDEEDVFQNNIPQILFIKEDSGYKPIGDKSIRIKYYHYHYLEEI